MKLTSVVLALVAASVSPALAQDAEAGKKVFNQCQTCHVVADPDGNVLAGKNAKTGPNLYGVIGRTAGTYEGFKYGDSIMAAGAAGVVWDAALITEYVQDPAAFLKAKTGDNKAKSKMSFKLKNADDAANVAAFLASLSPAPAEGATEAAPASN